MGWDWYILIVTNLYFAGYGNIKQAVGYRYLGVTKGVM